MKKKIKLLLFLIIVCQFISLVLVKADFDLTVGTTLTYEVEQSEWHYIVEGEESEGHGFKFDDRLFLNNNPLVVTIDYEEPFRVEYTVEVDSHTEEFVITPFIIVGLGLQLTYPYFLVEGLSNWIQTEADKGLGIQHIYFLEPNYAEEFFSMWDDDDFVASEYPSGLEGWYYNRVDGIYDNDDDIATFTWHFDTRYTRSGDDTDFSGTFEYTIEYNQLTGILTRYYMQVDYSGIWYYDSVSIESIQEVVLPSSTGNSEFKGILFFMPALAILGLMSSVNRKKKRE